MNPGTQALPPRSFSTVFKVALLTYHQHFQVRTLCHQGIRSIKWDREGRCVHVFVLLFLCAYLQPILFNVTLKFHPYCPYCNFNHISMMWNIMTVQNVKLQNLASTTSLFVARWCTIGECLWVMITIFLPHLGVSPQISGVWPSLTGGPEGRNFPSFHAWKPEITQTTRRFSLTLPANAGLGLDTFLFQRLIAWQSWTLWGSPSVGFQVKGNLGADFLAIWAVNLTFGISFFWTRKDEVEDHWNHLLYTMQSWWSEK